jgi:hypothetical protein
MPEAQKSITHHSQGYKACDIRLEMVDANLCEPD